MTLDPQLRAPIAIALGAIAGALARYYLTLWCTQRLGADFPYGTFFINVSGCFFMGLIATLALDERFIAPEMRLLLTTGFLGAYTTFSTYGLDTVNLIRLDRLVIAAGYGLGSAALGLLAVQGGTIVAQQILPWLHRWGK
ncbi:fluoride efflux transporter CrcB [Alkalinema sp. FACHB-956]|uniref:fluoride efflux transporter CrcB n=1 Tax=Alkalinema sp. FACHB-956 TaxID=2692768 RepID=UPI001683120B|nr:fluoride efflux transporter CrcB [Alkalinema sp. FACHB-956]MBD2327647.1 fluoride efflux transporter CrcB [Alkalinema sp. FACHB-956]